MIKAASLNGIALTGGQVFLQSVKNLGFPEVDFSVNNKGGFAGAKVSTPILGSYKIATEWVIVGTDFTDLMSQRRAFMQTLGSVISGGPKTFVLTLADNSQVQISVAALTVVADITVDDVNKSSLLVEMQTEYPLMQNYTQTSQNIPISSGGGFGIPFAMPFAMNVGALNTISVTNNGNYPAYPVFTFTGKLTNPSLTNLTTGDQININYSLTSATDQIVVDTYKRTVVILPSGNNGRQYVSGKFWTVPVGQSSIVLGNANQSDGGTCTVTFRDTFLGI
jgi:hypothetical protein